MQPITDKAGEEYWTNAWQHMKLAATMNPYSKNVNDFEIVLLHKIFQKYFSGINTSDKLMLEIGCGNSAYLPYFHKYFGFKIFGIDYSQLACEQTKKILEREHVEGEIILGDAFNPPQEMTGKFDVVTSFGVVEHFDRTAETLKEFYKFLKPGGLMITLIPNLAGLSGWLQKKFFRRVYDIHIPMDKNFLDAEIKKAGLELVYSEYCQGLNINVVLLDAKGRAKFYWLKKIFIRLFRYAIKIVWIFEMLLRPLPAGKIFSNYIITLAKRK
jgi:SAM-dependent methyltransferase